jgi:hypothetical protein
MKQVNPAKVRRGGYATVGCRILFHKHSYKKPAKEPKPLHIDNFKDGEMEAEYKHTQFGVLTLIIIFVTGVLIALVLLSMLAEGRLVVAFVMIGIYLLGLALFYAFTIEVSEGLLKFWFGIGGIGKSYSLKEIQSNQEVENPWYYFWGVKSIPGGWLYAIAPGSAVEIVFKNGKIVRLGTNQSKKLIQAIDDAITASVPPNVII